MVEKTFVVGVSIFSPAVTVGSAEGFSLISPPLSLATLLSRDSLFLSNPSGFSLNPPPIIARLGGDVTIDPRVSSNYKRRASEYLQVAKDTQQRNRELRCWFNVSSRVAHYIRSHPRNREVWRIHKARIVRGVARCTITFTKWRSPQLL